jgi:hypothetical protein
MRCLFAGLLSFFATYPVLADVAATVVFFSGTPQLTAANGVIRPLKKNDSFSSGETIDTADGRVQLRFEDGASMSLQPGAQFRVDSFRFSGSKERVTSGDGVVMTLVKGSLRTVTGWLGKQDRSQYRIGTSVATIGIRGTEFGAALDGSGLTVSTYAGLVEVCSEVGCVQVAPSETVWVRALGSRPELRSSLGGSNFRNGSVIPEAPLNREAIPLQQTITPVQQITQPIHQQQPSYTAPFSNSPSTAP